MTPLWMAFYLYPNTLPPTVETTLSTYSPFLDLGGISTCHTITDWIPKLVKGVGIQTQRQFLVDEEDLYFVLN